MTNKLPDREPDFYIPLTTDYFLQGWKIEDKDSFDLVFRLELRDGQECIYAERITNLDEFPSEIFGERMRDIRLAIFNSIVKQYAIKIEKPEGYEDKLLKFLSNK